MQCSFGEFFDGVYDAMKEAVRALGGPKKVGLMFWPELEKDPEKAANRLRDCMNPERREKLSIEQFMMLLRKACEVGCHSLMAFVASDTGYKTPDPQDPEEELAEAQAEFVEAVKALEGMAKRVEKLTARSSKPISRAA